MQNKISLTNKNILIDVQLYIYIYIYNSCIRLRRISLKRYALSYMEDVNSFVAVCQ